MIDKFHDLLREHGRSITRPRTALFEYLQQSGPVSISQFMRDNSSLADRASLYRTLLMFRELGVIDERIARNKRLVELTDSYDSHHHHLTCNLCGASVAVVMPEIEKALAALCRTQGFESQQHTIEASGICAGCHTS